MTELKHTVFLGFGSNIGDRRSAILNAAEAMTAHSGMALVRLSPLYASPAMLPENAPQDWDSEFLNAVGEYRTSLSPEHVLSLLQEQERRAGRQDRGKWGPRELDVDILAYDHLHRNDADLQLPHPGIASRDFVLLPWRDIAPGWQHPNIAELAGALGSITAKPL